MTRDQHERALWLADKLVGDYGAEAAQLLRAFADQGGPTVSLGGCGPTLFGSGGTFGTLGPFGLKVHVDPDMAEDEMEFRDGATGRVLAKIIDVGKA